MEFEICPLSSSHHEGWKIKFQFWYLRYIIHMGKSLQQQMKTIANLFVSKWRQLQTSSSANEDSCSIKVHLRVGSGKCKYVARTFWPRSFRSWIMPKVGCFGHNNKLWVGGRLHACTMCDAFSIYFLTCLLAIKLIRTNTVFISACKYMHAYNCIKYQI